MIDSLQFYAKNSKNVKTDIHLFLFFFTPSCYQQREYEQYHQYLEKKFSIFFFFSDSRNFLLWSSDKFYEKQLS